MRVVAGRNEVGRAGRKSRAGRREGGRAEWARQKDGGVDVRAKLREQECGCVRVYRRTCVRACVPV